MSGFRAPYSSSPPTTPGRRPGNGKNLFSFGASNPSTTPAGPPPSSSGSFTPAGLPPSSVFGSSVLDTTSKPVKPLSFTRNIHYGQSQQSSLSFMQSAAGTDYLPSRQNAYQDQGGYSEEDESAEDEYDEDYQEQDRDHFEESQRYGYHDPDEEDMLDEDEDMDGYRRDIPPEKLSNGFLPRSDSDLLLATPGGPRDSRAEFLESKSMSTNQPSNYGPLAKGVYLQLGAAVVEESDDAVLQTEGFIKRLYDEGVTGDSDDGELLTEALSVIPWELLKLWAAQNIPPYESEEYTATIGPSERATGFSKANFIAGLALQIHHPAILVEGSSPTIKPLPQIMLEWMDEQHDPYVSQFEDIQVHRPSPASHSLFWNTIFYGLLRGRIVAVVNILKNAGWKHARVEDDRSSGIDGQRGYSGLALSNIERVIGAAATVLSTCPAVKGDWDIRSSDWTMFRLKAAQALEDLKTFAEGKDGKLRESVNFEASSRSDTFSGTARKANSKVPWTIYQNLLTLYGLITGESSPIINNAQDWCEATVGLLVWWDEGKEDRKLVFGRSLARRSSRETDAKFYLRKLRRSFDLSTSDATDFEVNSVNHVEVGLASLFEGDTEAVVELLRAWSGPVSASVAEIANLAGWLPQAEPQSLINVFDQDDIDILGMNSSPSKLDGVKDQTLIAYAKSVARRGRMQSGRVTMDGWEIAIALFCRLNSTARSEEMVGDFLKSFPLDSSTTVDKLWKLLTKYGMFRHAESVAESYANSLAENSHQYGEAMWYYALSHKSTSVKDVLNLLVSYSLLNSAPYPAESVMDDYLRKLISSPKDTLTELSRMDVEAAELLHKMLSGYATLRSFYVLRDEAISLPKGRRPQKSTIARKEEAAAALLAVITSSGDNIRGGLYDEGRGAVVDVEFLLALLGESMIFVNQPDFAISASHINILLQAIEDLQTVGPRIYGSAEEFLNTVIASAPGLKGSTPHDMLRQSTSSMSGTSSFYMAGGSMLASRLKQSMSASGYLPKEPIQRGWDWRTGVTGKTRGEDVLRILRLGLAKDLSKALLAEVDNRM